MEALNGSRYGCRTLTYQYGVTRDINGWPGVCRLPSGIFKNNSPPQSILSNPPKLAINELCFGNAVKCWICNADANSGEHIVKASDLRSVFGLVNQQKPLYFHTEERRNTLVKGVKTNILKSGAKICTQCNTSRTQPYDRAWEKFSKYLRSRPMPVRAGQRIRLQKVLPGAVKRSMLAVHLYFVKALGCQIAKHDVPIVLAPFSNALLHGTAHPDLHLSVCAPVDGVRKSVGASDLRTASLGNRIRAAVWFYILDKFVIRIMYAETGESRQALQGSWHPSSVTKVIQVAGL